jgi:hypothetical protein
MNKKRLIWLIPILVTALAMSGCGGDDGGGSIGTNLNFSGQQVYTINSAGAFTPYTGADRTFTSNAGGAGSITGGKMSITVGVPSRLDPMGTFLDSIDEELNIFSYANYNPGDARAAALEFSSIELSKSDASQTATSMSKDQVSYVYVDRDCTIYIDGRPISTDLTVPVTLQTVNLSLKQGWNAVNIRISATMASGTLSINTGDLSNCKWVLSY